MKKALELLEVLLESNSLQSLVEVPRLDTKHIENGQLFEKFIQVIQNGQKLQECNMEGVFLDKS